jgi:hypothetical protein
LKEKEGEEYGVISTGACEIEVDAEILQEKKGMLLLMRLLIMVGTRGPRAIGNGT